MNALVYIMYEFTNDTKEAAALTVDEIKHTYLVCFIHKIDKVRG